jgi:hypothetical protein
MNTPEEDFTLTDEAFHTYVRNHVKFTLTHIDGHESLIPELVIITRDHDGKDAMTLCALAVPFNEDHEKLAVLFTLGKQMYDEKKVTLAVILASEAWMSTIPKDAKPPFVQPRYDPNRKEHIIVVGSGLLERQRLFVFTPITRDDKNLMRIDGESMEIPEARFPLLEHFWRGFFHSILPRQT